MNVEPLKVIEMVKHKEWANHLYHHERNKRIINTSGAYYYLDKQNKYQVLSGLRPRLHLVFWPNSNYYQMMKRSKSHITEKKKAKKKASRREYASIKKSQNEKEKEKKAKKENRGQFGGLICGNQVHTQMKDFVMLDKRNFKKKHKTLHPYCTKIMDALIRRLKLKVFLSEADIYDECLGIGTSIDMICLDKEGLLEIIELKTGYKTYYDCEDGKMLRSLSAMRNTIQNQSVIQVLVGAVILHRAFGIPLSQMRLKVIRVDDESLDIISVPDEFLIKMAPLVYNDLLEYNKNK
jgi:hypothetical protein